MPRLNQFQNSPVAQRFFLYAMSVNTYLKFQGIYLAGSLSFNNVIMALSASGTTSKSITISLGLYSLNGSTLSLANSASFSNAYNANTFEWITLATSAAQDLTAGNWYLGIIQSTSSNSLMSLGYLQANIQGTANSLQTDGLYLAILLTSVLVTSVATADLRYPSDLSNNETTRQPYILISA